MNQSTKLKSKFYKAWIGWLTFLSIASCGGWLVYNYRNTSTNESIAVVPINVNKGTVEEIINESGVVELGGQQILEAPGDGIVAEVLIRIGSRFNGGQNLVLLHDPKRKTSTIQHQLKIQQTQVDLVASRQKLTDAKVNLAVAQKKLEANEALFARGFISEEELQNQRNATRQAQSTILQSESAQKKLRLQLQELQFKGLELKEELKKNLVVAPTTGKVLEVKIKRGDVVELGDDLLLIGDPTKEIVKLELSTLNARRVELNLPVRVNTIGVNAESFTGKIISLALIADRSSNSIIGSQSQTTVSAVVELDYPSGKLIPGSQVSVDIILEQQKDVIVLPTLAVQRIGSETFVWILDSQGNAYKQPVSLGLEGITTVEITSGLQANDLIIQPLGETTLEPGMAIDLP